MESVLSVLKNFTVMYPIKLSGNELKSLKLLHEQREIDVCREKYSTMQILSEKLRQIILLLLRGFLNRSEGWIVSSSRHDRRIVWRLRYRCRETGGIS